MDIYTIFNLRQLKSEQVDKVLYGVVIRDLTGKEKVAHINIHKEKNEEPQSPRIQGLKQNLLWETLEGYINEVK